MKLHKLSNKYDIYIAEGESSRSNEVMVLINGAKHYRFMDRFYIPHHVFHLSEEAVIELNNIRRDYAADVVDVEFNTLVYEKTLSAVAARQSKQKRILDFGCGEGGAAPIIMKHFSQTELHGYDLREIVQNDNYLDIKSGCRDCTIPYGNGYFSAVFAFFVFHFYISDIQIQELMRMLEHDGILAFNLINSSDFGVIDRLCAAGFSIEEELEYSSLSNSGKGFLFFAHNGNN